MNRIGEIYESNHLSVLIAVVVLFGIYISSIKNKNIVKSKSIIIEDDELNDDSKKILLKPNDSIDKTEKIITDNNKLNNSQNMKKIHQEILNSYLVLGWSHRKIEKNILKIVSPARGGGFEAMKILHSYSVKGDKKGVLKDRNIQDELKIASGNYRVALELLSTNDHNNINQNVTKENNSNLNKTNSINLNINNEIMENRLYNNTQIQLLIVEKAKTLPLLSLDELCNEEFSYRVFGNIYPVFKKCPKNYNSDQINKIKRDDKGYNRWTVKYKFERNGNFYLVSTQWYPRNDELVRIWLRNNH